MDNAIIRKLIKESRYFNYEIAEKMGISEYTLSKWFRKPLSSKQADSIMKAISSLKGEL